MLAAERLAHAVEIAARRESEQRMRAAAEAANRAKDEFLALLSHELRNPLSAVRNAVLASRLDPSSRERALEIAGRQLEHLTRLVDDLLDVARITQGKIRLRLERVRLRDVTVPAIESARSFVEGRGHTLSLVSTGDGTVEGDPARLEQIVENLVTNAAKYTPPGGQLARGVRAGSYHQDVVRGGPGNYDAKIAFFVNASTRSAFLVTDGAVAGEAPGEMSAQAEALESLRLTASMLPLKLARLPQCLCR
jgi:signal transduction histidine kinase